jgi:hypothetical protein
MKVIHNIPIELKRDARLQLIPQEETLAVNGGLQPFSVITSKGTLLTQVHMPEQSHPSDRIHFYWRIGSYISRDSGVNWSRADQLGGANELYMEGGAIELRNGTFLQLDTYITPGEPGYGKGLMLLSQDDLQTYEGPIEIDFELPGVNFDGHDDGGNPHRAMRLHRRILELPNGHLLTVLYGWYQGEETSSGYMPSMKKTRCMLVRSEDKGRNWKFISTIASGMEIGTEGFCEPDLVRLSQGEKEGTLLCYMRTGREMYWCESIDEGVTWSKSVPEQFGIVDVNDTKSWEAFFVNTTATKRSGHITDLAGAFVDPNIIELKNGVLACAFGLRIPQKMCWDNPTHERNGNYLAFSLDQGSTWSHVVQLTSGVLTTHYMDIQEIQENVLYVMYDIGHWHEGYWDGEKGRYTCARKIALKFDIN